MSCFSSVVKTGCFVLLFSLFLSSCDNATVIIHGVDEREANEILVTLYEENISAEKMIGEGKEVNWNITVPKEKKIPSLSILTRRGFPRSKRDSILQIINRSSGLVPSETTEELKFREGKARQIENTILKMDGIIDASVEISYPKEDPLNPGKKKDNLTASVYVKLEGPLDPNTQLVSRIKRLVAGSINGLEFENVTVITDQTRISDYMKNHKPQSLLQQANLVKIWSITLSKDSQSTFQAIFFSFLCLLFIFALLLAFVLWKYLPMTLKSPKGIQLLFLNFSPLKLQDFEKEASEEEDKGSSPEEEEGEDEEGEDGEEEQEEEEDLPPPISS